MNNTEDSVEDLVLIECVGKEFLNPQNRTYISYNCSINTYFINGTMKSSINNIFEGQPEHSALSFDTFRYFDEPHMLLTSPNYLVLYNLSSSNILDEIYTKFSPSGEKSKG